MPIDKWKDEETVVHVLLQPQRNAFESFTELNEPRTLMPQSEISQKEKKQSVY